MFTNYFSPDDESFISLNARNKKQLNLIGKFRRKQFFSFCSDRS